MPVVEKVKGSRGFRAKCTCDQCGKPFERWLSAVRCIRTFCSTACSDASRERPWSERAVHVGNNGYKRVCHEGRPYPLHRLIMEEMLGRKLESWELVHHKDFDKLNNDPTNLELRTCNNHRHAPGYTDVNLETINSLLQQIVVLKRQVIKG